MEQMDERRAGSDKRDEETNLQVTPSSLSATMGAGAPSSLKISLPPAYSPPPRSSHRPLIPRAFILLLSLAYTIYILLPAPTLNFAHLATSVQCPGLEGISRDEFGGRQGRLASLLTRESGEGFGVYVSEPGYVPSLSSSYLLTLRTDPTRYTT
jgi:hypothetical protein